MGQRWPTGPAPTLPSTEAVTVATTARADAQMCERIDSNERGHPIGAAGKTLKQEVCSRRQGQPEGSDHSEDVTHRRTEWD